MNPEPITFYYHGSQLLVVPAIHFHYVFATEVNRICYYPETRPEAIAVELGSKSVKAVKTWLQELGAGSENSKKLPIMLGLTKRNNMIRSSLKQKALQLQHETGEDLSELSPELLYHKLGFTGCGLLCISPTDSIIEAIRCAIELKLPVYGVDLEDMADSKHKATMIQDPIVAEGNLIAYIAHNAPYAAQQRDEEIDSRREIAMAARLKTLLQQYSRVVFTCGMGHWLQVKKLIVDPSINPAPNSEIADETEKDLRRVVVHPLIAINHIDLFPVLTAEYEKLRKVPYKYDKQADKWAYLNPYKLFQDLLKKACIDYFCCKAQDQLSAKHKQDLKSLCDFEGYLNNLCLVNFRRLPDLSLTLKAAKDIMSKGFVMALSKALMDISWAKPYEYPGYRFLAPSHDDEFTYALYDENNSQDEESFYIRTIPANSKHGVRIEIPYEWEKTQEYRLLQKEDEMTLHTWMPWDNLISGMSLRAIGHIKKERYDKKVEVFEGSLLDGIDIKSTLRSCSRGKECVYVRDDIKNQLSHTSLHCEGFPVVWILQPGAHRHAEWTALYEDFRWMEKYVKDREQFNYIKKKRGNRMIALIGYGDLYTRTKASDINSRIRCDRYYGIVVFQPICWARSQFAYWMEYTGYKRNPFCYRNYIRELVPSDLTTFLEKKHDIRIGKFDWPTTLMLLAIPFAKDVLTVTIPDNFKIDPIVFERAKRYGVEVCASSLNSFSQKEKERLSLNYMVPITTYDPKCKYPESYEEAIGERQNDYQDLVPKSCLNFGIEI